MTTFSASHTSLPFFFFFLASDHDNDAIFQILVFCFKLTQRYASTHNNRFPLQDLAILQECGAQRLSPC